MAHAKSNPNNNYSTLITSIDSVPSKNKYLIVLQNTHLLTKVCVLKQIIEEILKTDSFE